MNKVQISAVIALATTAGIAAFIGPAGGNTSAWDPNGVLMCTAPGSKFSPFVASDGLGGCYAAWSEIRVFPNRDVYLQHVVEGGTIALGWPTEGIPVVALPQNEAAIGVRSDGVGGCYVAALNTTGSNLRIQRIGSDAATMPGWPANGVIVGDWSLSSHALVSDGVDGLFVVYERALPGMQSRIYVQRITGQGQVATGWPPYGRPIGALDVNQVEPTAVSDGSDGLLVTWADYRNDVSSLGDLDLFALRLTSQGEPAPGWPANGIPVCAVISQQRFSRLVADGSGGALVAWEDDRSGNDIFAHHILGTGSMDPRWPVNGLAVCQQPGPQLETQVCTDGSGGMFVTWADYRVPGGDIYAHHLGVEGTAVNGWQPDGNPIAPRPGYDIHIPPPIPDGIGGFYLTWENQSPERHVFTQHIAFDGSLGLGGQPGGTLLVSTPGEQVTPWITADGYGGAIVVWDDMRRGGGSDDVYALRIGPDGPTAVAVSLVSALGEPGAARLAWQVTGGTARFGLERRTEQQSWRSIATVTADGSGRVAYEDRGLAPERYAYRLAYSDDASARTTPEVWVDVPAAYRLELAGFKPNPTSGQNLQVSFSLPRSGNGALSLYDIAGRELARESLVGLASGRHTLRLATGSTVPAGMYWLRLTHDGRTLTTRGVVVR